VYRFDGPSQLAMRHVSHVAWANERYAISLPLPWPNLEQEKPVPAEVMVRMHPLQQRVQIGVAVLDEAFGALSGLMTASTLPKAAIAVEQAEDMLYWKGKNPLAAAAGGYVLLAAGDPKQTRWHQWIENLEARFPDLPDGAVLKGCLRLRYPRDTNSPDEALAAFIRAFDRGIPFFSAGVAWLLDGLTLFADDEATDERSVQLQSKLMQVQRIAQRLDLSQAFTVVRLSDRIAS
jgi:hypothetical protein